MKVPDKLHIKAYDCRCGGQLDFGSLPFSKAVATIVGLFEQGDIGGCRCARGWKLSPCPDKEHDCSEFTRNKFDFWDEALTPERAS